jgi:hypothetical protein
MRRALRAALVAAAVTATLAFASAAFAANTGSLAVSQTSAGATTFSVALPQANDPPAAVNIYSPTGYTVNLNQATNTSIGSVEATAYSWDNNLTLPLSGTVVKDDPAKYADVSALCTRTPLSAAVWILNLSVAGQTLPVPVFVNPTTGAEQALGGYKFSICLTPGDVPPGTPGRATAGNQLLEAKVTVNGVFTTPTASALNRWEALVTPYTPKRGTVNPAGTFELRAFAPSPVTVALQSKYSKRTRAFALTGRVSEDGKPADAGTSVVILRGPTQTSTKKVATVKTGANGTFRYSGKLVPRKSTFFAATASAAERDYTATGCQSPLTTAAPAGCVKATLAPWTAKSATIRIRS